MLKTTIFYSRSILGAMLLVMGMAMVPAIATAPMPPQLVLSKLNGQRIHILYLTRSKDRVLVRCYPGLQPSVTVRNLAAGSKEGTLTCGN